MSIILYDLAGAEDDRRFSPFCWRIRLALEHKELKFEAVPWRFTEKEKIAFSGQGKVPVIQDRERSVHDSWDIACYLEDTYPNHPSLFGGPAGRALCRFFVDWTDTVVHPGLIRLIATDIHAHLHEKDKDYFRSTREERFRATLEDFCDRRGEWIKEFRRSLTPLRTTLARQTFLGGDAPVFADYAVGSAFLWARAVSPFLVLEADDPVASWRARIVDRLQASSRSLLCYSG